jgi:hypothetical protein
MLFEPRQLRLSGAESETSLVSTALENFQQTMVLELHATHVIAFLDCFPLGSSMINNLILLLYCHARLCGI